MRPADRLGGAAILQHNEMKGTVSARGKYLKWDVWAQTDLTTERMRMCMTLHESRARRAAPITWTYVVLNLVELGGAGATGNLGSAVVRVG